MYEMYTKHWTTLKKLIYLKAIQNGSGGTEYTGDIVQFETTRAKKLKSLQVSLSPIQDLHGYDSPWPAGGGKNKLSPLTIGKGLDAVDGSETTNSTDACTDYIPVDFASYANYTLSGMDGTLYCFVAGYNAQKQFIHRTGASNYSGLTFGSSNFIAGTSQGSGDIVYIRVTIYENPNVTGVITDINNWNMQLEVGNSQTSWTPYENICPIYGHTGATAYDDSRYGGLVDWNQIYNSALQLTDSYDGITYTNNGDGSFTLNGTTEGPGNITRVGVTFTPNHYYLYYVGDTNLVLTHSPMFDTKKGNKILKYTGGTVAVQSVNFYVGQSGIEFDNIIVYPMVFDLTQMFGAGNEPTVSEFLEFFPKQYYAYTLGGTLKTVCEVNGEPWWVKSVEFPALGKNKWDYAHPVSVYNASLTDNGDGTFSVVGSTANSKLFYLVDGLTPNQKYSIIIGITDATGNTGVFGYSTIYDGEDDTANVLLNSANLATRKDFTPTGSKVYISFGVTGGNGSGSATTVNPTIEAGDTITAYEPYTNTVYSGTVDIVTGDGVADMAMRDIGTLNWSYLSPASSYPYGLFYAVVSGKARGEINFITSCYPISDSYFTKDKTCLGNISGNTLYIVDSSYNGDTAALKAALSGQQICYELATPITYQLTPQEVMSLVGENVVWSEDGQVTVRV